MYTDTRSFIIIIIIIIIYSSNLNNYKDKKSTYKYSEAFLENVSRCVRKLTADFQTHTYKKMSCLLKSETQNCTEHIKTA